ncbi:hypothetical protein [Bdellovibrio sp. HCB288]|uniref:hypothetical protein n=1 Tax=Bdellovibrio sp. HCB288 TaxID=3394355 RepID=UPI0039B5E75B
MTKWILLLILPFLPALGFAKPEMRGLRVDPSYFYELYPEKTAPEIAQLVVHKAMQAHVNTLFLYAYVSNHGAFYPTDYPLTTVETHFGEKNIFNEIYTLARAHDFHVVAVINVTDNKSVWDARPEWRSKTPNGGDYKPMSQTYILSAWHPEYRQWLQGFVKDLTDKFPHLYAVEAVEPTVDCFWRLEADFNPEANKAFFARHPDGQLGDKNWLVMRAEGVTDLLGIMAEVSHAKGIKAGVVQTWPALADGSLSTPEQIRDDVGFDLNGILNLQGAKKMDFVVGELLWQQWRGEFGNPVFNPAWTLPAALEFKELVANRSEVVIHIEISTWHGQHSSVTPNLAEFQESLEVISKEIPHIDVYDYSQIENRHAWNALAAWK